MTQAQPGLAEMNARMQQWMNEKPQQFGANSTELNLQQNDMVIFQFASNGNDGDRLIKAYRSHIFGQVSPRGKRFNESRYCAVQNGEGQECMFCQQGHTDIKERMSMWLLVHQILHAALPQVQQGQPMPDWPIVNYEGANYYMEQVNAWKIWHTSAWRESPWSDICRAASMYNGLHNFTAEIQCTGQGMAKRFKFVVLPNSATLPLEYYQQAWDSLTPIPDMLRAEMTRQLRQNPQPQGGQWSGAAPVANNFVPGGIPFQPVVQPQVFVPPAAPAPPMAVPMAAPPLAVAPPAPVATFQPGNPGTVPVGGNAPTVGAPGGSVPAVPVASAAPEAPSAPAPTPVQAVAAPVAPPSLPATPTPVAVPPAAPAIPQQAPALPATPQPPAPPTNEVQQAPDDGRRPMRRMF